MLIRMMALIVAGAAATASAQQPVPSTAPLVFDQVTVIDVEQGKLLPDQRVVVAGNRIRAVGAANMVTIPTGAQVVHAQGKYLIPGLWDLHTHPRYLADYFHPLFIANGITGIRDAKSSVPLATQVQWWRAILAGTRVGPPRQLLAGRALRGRVAQRSVALLKDAGANFLKGYSVSYSLAAAARRAGLRFGGHLAEPAMAMSDSGISILDHWGSGGNGGGGLDSLCLRRDLHASLARCRPVAERFRQNNTWWVPTIVRALHHVPANENWPNPGPATLAAWLRFTETAHRFWTDSALPSNWLRGAVHREVADSFQFLALAQQVGLPILAGTDAGAPVMEALSPGFTLHAELALYVVEGLTPLEALRTATLNPAKMLQGTDSLGTVAPGKLADLVLLDADPLADIANTTMIRAVVANGRYFDRTTLDRLLADVRAKVRAEPQPFGKQVEPLDGVIDLVVGKAPVSVLPVAVVTATSGLQTDPRYAPYRDPHAALAWADSLIGAMLMKRMPDVSWVLPAKLRQLARASGDQVEDPDTYDQATLRTYRSNGLFDPLRTKLSKLTAAAGGTWALLPFAVDFRPPADGQAIRADLWIELVEASKGKAWRNDGFAGTGATPAAALEAALALAFPVP